MKGLRHIKKIREYCNYIEDHLLKVNDSWEIIKITCRDMNFVYDDFLFWHITKLIYLHDVSKMSIEEFIPYQQKFFPVEKPDDTWFSSALQHHYDFNPHHWQNWTTRKETFPNEQTCHCVCMIADWMAMGMKFGDTAEQYYEKNKVKIDLPDWAIEFISEIFQRLRDVRVIRCASCGEYQEWDEETPLCKSCQHNLMTVPCGWENKEKENVRRQTDGAGPERTGGKDPDEAALPG